MRLSGFLLVFLAADASAGPARATLHVRPDDRAILVRTPDATATARVVPKNGARATLDVAPDSSGTWHLDPKLLTGGATLFVGAAAFLEFEESGGAAPADPELIEAGETAIEVAVPAQVAAPADCDLALDHADASIRQDFDGADVLFSGENGATRAVFFGFVAADQAGPATATLVAAGVTRSWPATVYAWRWVADRRSVQQGEDAVFTLDVDGLPEGAQFDVVLEAANGLELRNAPGAFEPAGPGQWHFRGTEGKFTFASPTEGECAVTADLTPCGK